MDKKANDTFAFDLENRLDDFFSDSLPSQDDASADDPAEPKADLPLKELKSTILAIDWEITDDVLGIFIQQIDELMEKFADDKVSYTLLKILKSLGKYIRTHKSKAHPDTIKRIMAVYSALEESVANDELSPDAKDNMLREQINQFQRLKSLIVQSKSPRPASGSKKPMGADASETPAIDAVIKAVDELKSIMAAELSAIREEMKQLRKK